jgi:hypothetical protein
VHFEAFQLEEIADLLNKDKYGSKPTIITNRNNNKFELSIERYRELKSSI